MAGSAEQHWRIPQKFQEIISGVIVALLVAGIVSLFDLWGTVSDVLKDSSHMREQQALVHGELVEQIGVLTQLRVSSDIKASRYFERTDQQGERVKELNADIQRLESLLTTFNKPDL